MSIASARISINIVEPKLFYSCWQIKPGSYPLSSWNEEGNKCVG